MVHCTLLKHSRQESPTHAFAGKGFALHRLLDTHAAYGMCFAAGDAKDIARHTSGTLKGYIATTHSIPHRNLDHGNSSRLDSKTQCPNMMRVPQHKAAKSTSMDSSS